MADKLVAVGDDLKIPPSVIVPADQILDTATKVAMTAAERSKLTSLPSDFVEAVHDAVNGLLASGVGISLSYDDTGNSLTITGVTSLDAEAVRDAIGVAMVGVGLVTVTVNDPGDTITISTTATANDTDANLKNRDNHTGTQPFSTISGQSTLAQACPGSVFKCPWNGTTSKWQWPVGTDLDARPSARTDIHFEFVGAPYTYDISQPTYALDIDGREDV